jgi:signal transduction histidine kinase
MKTLEAQRELEAHIQHTQKLKSLGTLAGGIAHHFNSTLTGVLGNAELARSEIPPTSGAHEHLQQIETAATKAAKLCEQLVGYSGKGKFSVRAFSLSQLIEGLAPLLEVSVGKSICMEYELPRNLPAIEGDATQMRQLLLDLVTNASEAIGDQGGLICLTTRTLTLSGFDLKALGVNRDLPAGPLVELEVRDTGCGMDAQTRSQLFDPFFSTKFVGRGLGLAAALGIVRGHRGAVHVESESDRGTSIRVLLPVCPRPPDPLVESLFE